MIYICIHPYTYMCMYIYIYPANVSMYSYIYILNHTHIFMSSWLRNGDRADFHIWAISRLSVEIIAELHQFPQLRVDIRPSRYICTRTTGFSATIQTNICQFNVCVQKMPIAHFILKSAVGVFHTLWGKYALKIISLPLIYEQIEKPASHWQRMSNNNNNIYN